MDISTILFYWSIAVIIWYISHIFDDIGDEVLFRTHESIFTRIFQPHQKGYYYFVLEQDWWSRKYVNHNPLLGRKKWHGITIPAAFFDAWHGAKILRKFCHYNMSYVFIYPMLSLMTEYVVACYFAGLLFFMLISYISHKNWFDGLLRVK